MPAEGGPDHYDVPASLNFGTFDWNEDGIKAELFLTAAYLDIPVTSYQPSRDKTVGEAGRKNNKNFQKTGGVIKIVGPLQNDRLHGDALLGESFITTVEPAVRGKKPLTIRITAGSNDLTAFGKTVVNGVDADVTVDQNKVMKLLLSQGCRRDGATPQMILAEWQWVRKRER